MSDNLSINGGTLVLFPQVAAGISYSTTDKDEPIAVRLRPINSTPEEWIAVIRAAVGPRLKMLRSILVIDTIDLVHAEAITDLKIACKVLSIAHGASLSRISAFAAKSIAYDARVPLDDVIGDVKAVESWRRSGGTGEQLIAVDEMRQHDRSEAKALHHHVTVATAAHQGALN